MFYVKSRGAIPRSPRVEDIFQEWPAAADDQSSLSADGSWGHPIPITSLPTSIPKAAVLGCSGTSIIIAIVTVYIYILTMTDYG